MDHKKKTCLIVVPTNHNQDISLTLKISTLTEIIKEFDNEKIELKIATYRGNKPFLNFENEDKNRKWVEQNEDLLLNVLNIDNISPGKYDGIVIPNYLFIYDELKISDHSLTKLIAKFHKANKLICAVGHATYALCKCKCLNQDEDEYSSSSGDSQNFQPWSFIGYNLTGFSLNNLMRENLFGTVPYIIEEMVSLQGGNFISSYEGSLSDDIMVISDRNVITAMDDNSLKLCLYNLTKKLRM